MVTCIGKLYSDTKLYVVVHTAALFKMIILRFLNKFAIENVKKKKKKSNALLHYLYSATRVCFDTQMCLRVAKLAQEVFSRRVVIFYFNRHLIPSAIQRSVWKYVKNLPRLDVLLTRLT